MATRSSLQSKWIDGYKPDQDDYAELFNSVYFKESDPFVGGKTHDNIQINVAPATTHSVSATDVKYQIFRNSNIEFTIKLPDSTTLTDEHSSFVIINETLFDAYVQSYIANSILTLPRSTASLFVCYDKNNQLWTSLKFFNGSVSGGSTVDTTPPTITGGNANVAENITVVYDYNANEAVTWSVSGVDSDKFNINSSGILSFKIAPDYENPTDADLNNTYLLDIIATDSSGNKTSKPVVITVQNAGEQIPDALITSFEIGECYIGDTTVSLTVTADPTVTQYLISTVDEQKSPADPNWTSNVPTSYDISSIT